MLKYFLIIITFTSVFLSSFLHAEENLFEKNYQIQSPKGFKSFSVNPDTKILRGWARDTDNIKMLEDGYDLMGFSGFTSLNLSPDLALQHGKSIKADLILIYDRQINENTRATAIQRARDQVLKEQLDKDGNTTEILIDEDDLLDPNARFEFYATYWVKLPKPTFGTHFIKVTNRNTDEDIPGLKVIAVIKESPAFKSGILRGDEIQSVNGIKVSNPEELIAVIQKNKGSEIKVDFLRNGSGLTVNVLI